MRILVTGGAGFIGSSLVNVLANAGHRLTVVDKLTYAGMRSNLNYAVGLGAILEIADICDLPTMSRILKVTRPQAIYHLAAETHVDRSIDQPQEFVRVNAVGTAVLLEAACRYWEKLPLEQQEIFRFIHISTDEVFGEAHGNSLFYATTPYQPNSPYAASKAASDHLVRAWTRTYGFPALISNCSNNYGPRQFPEKLIPTIILRGLQEKSLPLYGNGENIRDWLYVEDHAEALQLIFERGTIGETYLVGGRCEKKNIELVTQMCTILDELRPRREGASYSDLIEFVLDRPGHDFRYAIDPSKIETDLGWKPRWTFDDGLRATIDWYLNNKSWCDKALERYRLGRQGLSRSCR